MLKGGYFAFELHVEAHGASDGADGSGADAMLADGGDGGFSQFGVVAQAEVVVGGEINDLLAVVPADRALHIFELAQAEVRAVGAQGVKLGGEVGQLGTGLQSLGRGERCGSGHGNSLDSLNP